MWHTLFRWRSAMLACLLVFTTLGGNHAIVHATPNAPQAESEDGEIAPGPQATWDTAGDETNASPSSTTRSTNPTAATDCLGSPTRRIRYTSDGVIHLEGCNQAFTLSDIAASPAAGPARLVLVDAANKIWQLNVKLRVEEGATLRVVGGANGDANWLRLRSDATTGVWLRAERGNLLFRDTKVTSWDPSANDVDRNTAVAANGSGGRSYIAARSVLSAGRQTAPPTACDVNGGTQEPYEARMDVINSEIAYLGYNAAESYGIVWKVYYKTDPAIPGDAPPPNRGLYALVDVFGQVENSQFHHNYFGSYTYGAYCMPWTRNVFADNIQYGLDPHDDSDYLTIRENVFRDNGNHGVICSIECNNIVIANNQSLRNRHGIMIHRNVNGAIIEGNTSADNRGAGIAIFDSHDALVRNNTVTNNAEAAIRLSVGASRNLIERNTLVGASGASGGHIVYTFKGSDLPTTGDGMPKDNVFRANTMRAGNPLVWKLTDTANTRFESNSLEANNPQFEFRRSPNTVVRDLATSAPLQVKLDASNVRIEDTSGRIFQSSPQADTTISATGSTIQATASTTFTPRDLRVRPAANSLAAQITAWEEARREWKLRASSSGNTMTQSLAGLRAGSCYALAANNQLVNTAQADTQGQITWTVSMPSAETVFRVTPANCGTTPAPPSTTNGPTPQYRTLLPFVDS